MTGVNNDCEGRHLVLYLRIDLDRVGQGRWCRLWDRLRNKCRLRGFLRWCFGGCRRAQNCRRGYRTFDLGNRLSLLGWGLSHRHMDGPAARQHCVICQRLFGRQTCPNIF